jgi:hypothetical protein
MSHTRQIHGNVKWFWESEVPPRFRFNQCVCERLVDQESILLSLSDVSGSDRVTVRAQERRDVPSEMFWQFLGYSV